ncbi:MAG: PorT family protein [Chitinophagaceae bacterium]|nr:PorT family protein [Chitinophagaceae bacterium]
MKKTPIIPFLALVMFFTLGQQSFAQISVGAKGGLNVSNLSGVNDIEGLESNALVGFHLGGFVTFNLGRNFAIQPELLFSTQGAKWEGFGESENLKLNYFNIPVMVKFLTNSGFYLEAGPQLGLRTGDVTFDDEDISDEFESSDVSACFGLGFQPTKSPFGIGARYNIGLGTVSELEDFDEETVDVKNGVFQLSLYWRFLGGGKLKASHKATKMPKTVL